MRLRHIRFVEPLGAFEDGDDHSNNNKNENNNNNSSKNKETASFFQHTLTSRPIVEEDTCATNSPTISINTMTTTTTTSNNSNNNKKKIGGGGGAANNNTTPTMHPLFRNPPIETYSEQVAEYAPLVRHDVMKAKQSGQVASVNNHIKEDSASSSLSSENNKNTTSVTSIYNVWEPWCGTATFRYVERLDKKSSNKTAKNTNSNTTTTSDTPTTHNLTSDEIEAINRSSSFIATRDQLAADFKLFRGDVAWIDNGEYSDTNNNSSSQQQQQDNEGFHGAVRCDSLTHRFSIGEDKTTSKGDDSEEFVVHDFHFLVPPRNLPNNNNNRTMISDNTHNNEASSTTRGSVTIARNSSISDDEYFNRSHSAAEDADELLRYAVTGGGGASRNNNNNSNMSGRVTSNSTRTPSQANSVKTGHNNNNDMNRVQAILNNNNNDDSYNNNNNGYIRLLAGNMCSTPQAPLITCCTIPQSTTMEKSGISLFAVEVVLKNDISKNNNSKIRVPLSAQKHQSCVAFVISTGGCCEDGDNNDNKTNLCHKVNGVRVMNGDVDPVGVLCKKGDAIALSPMGDVVEFRSDVRIGNSSNVDNMDTQQQQQQLGDTVILILSASFNNNSIPSRTSVNQNNQEICCFTPHSLSKVFASSLDTVLDQRVAAAAASSSSSSPLFALFERLSRYQEGLLSRTSALVKNIRPIEVKNKLRSKRVIYIKNHASSLQSDPFNGRTASKSIQVIHRNRTPYLIGLAENGTELFQYNLMKKNATSKQLDNNNNIDLVASAKNNSGSNYKNHRRRFVQVTTLATIMGKQVLVGFSPSTESICVVHFSEEIVVDGSSGDMVSWYTCKPLYETIRNKLAATIRKTKLSSDEQQEQQQQGQFIGASELKASGEILLYYSNTNQEEQETKTTQKNNNKISSVEAITFKVSELWKFLMTQKDEDVVVVAGNSNNEGSSEETTSSFTFTSIAVKSIPLPTLQDGSRLVLKSACAPFSPESGENGSLTELICTVQLQPPPGNEFIKSTQTMLQKIAGDPVQIRRRPVFGSGVVVMQEQGRRLTEFCPLTLKQKTPNVEREDRGDFFMLFGENFKRIYDQQADLAEKNKDFSKLRRTFGGNDNEDVMTNNTHAESKQQQNSALSSSPSSTVAADEARNNNISASSFTKLGHSSANNLSTYRQQQLIKYNREQLAENAPLAIMNSKQLQSAFFSQIFALAENCIGEVPRMLEVRGICYLGAMQNNNNNNNSSDEFIILFSVTRMKIGNKNATEAAAEDVVAVKKKQKAEVFEDEEILHFMAFASLLSEKQVIQMNSHNQNQHSNVGEVLMSSLTCSLRDRVNDGNKPSL